MGKFDLGSRNLRYLRSVPFFQKDVETQSDDRSRDRVSYAIVERFHVIDDMKYSVGEGNFHRLHSPVKGSVMVLALSMMVLTFSQNPRHHAGGMVNHWHDPGIIQPGGADHPDGADDPALVIAVGGHHQA